MTTGTTSRASSKGRKGAGKSRRKVIAVTHGPFCLDGLASAACLGRFYGPERVTPVFTHPSDVDQVLRDIGDSPQKPGDLWITDITWKKPETEEVFRNLVDKGWRIFWVDHHTAALDKTDREIKRMGLTGWVASNRYSAARLLYDYLVSSPELLGRPPAALKAFRKAVLLADDNDRWIHRFTGSRRLALTVSSLGGMPMYKELLKVSSGMKFTPRMEESYLTACRELSASVTLAKRTRLDRSLNPDGLKVITALCMGYTSEVADSLRETLEDDSERVIFLLFNLDDGRVSIRKTPSCQVNLSDLAGYFGGGGHPAAAGFDLPRARDHLQDYLFSRIEEAMNA
ncbi:MAG TPA: DHHA1 domain-containing protein [Nitrospiria bacterium]